MISTISKRAEDSNVSKELQITVLIENKVHHADLLSEHGLSLWIEYKRKRILFDAGQSRRLLDNARALNVDLAQTDTIVISHGHYDHTGGLPAVLALAPQAKVMMHPVAIKSKYSKKVSGMKENGMSCQSKNAIDRHQEVMWTRSAVEVCPGISVTGTVPRLTEYEDPGGAFYTDRECLHPDSIIDDQSLWIESSQGLVVILGCAHAGTVNILDYISKLSRQDTIYAVIGGMHLLHADSRRIKETIEAFRKYRVQFLAPMHCTGESAMEILRKELGDQCIFPATGDRIELPL